MKKYFLFFFLVSTAQIILGQASLEVQLMDGKKQSVPLAYVVIENPKIGYKKEVIASELGKIQLDGLSTSGSYNIIVPETNFYAESRLENVILFSNKTTSVTVLLNEKILELAQVTVIAEEYIAINEVDAEVASELSSKEITKLPVEGRDITRVLYRLPNISQATGFFPEAPNVAINGANALYTNYQIDGLDNNENFLGGQRFNIPIGFTRNITALTNNFSAEHGLTSNGIINITSRSGTNELEGELYYNLRPGPVIDSPSPFAQRDLSGNQVKDGFQRHQAGFGIGGAIIPNKTFYFVNVEHTTDLKDNLLNVPELGINETVNGTNNFSYISAKLDHNWSDRFRSSIRINTGLVNIERQGGGLDGGVIFPSAGNRQDRNSLNIALKNTFSNESFTYEGNYQFGRFRWNYANPENDDSPNVTVLDPQEQPIAILGHPGYVFDEIENTHVLQQKFTFDLNEHRLKLGGQVKSSGFELFGGGNPNGSYTVRLNSFQLGTLQQNATTELMPEDIPPGVEVLNYGIELRPNSFQKRQNIFSLYIEDQWTVSSRLNLSAGLRYDYDNLSKGGGDKGDFDNIAPRISGNFKLTPNSSIRAGYGIYYDKILYAIYSDALQFNSTSEDYKAQLNQLVSLGILPADTDVEQITNEGNLVGNVSGVTYLNGPSSELLQNQREAVFQNELRVLNPNGYDNPYSHQMMLGYQLKLSDNMLFYADIMHNRSYNLFRLRNLNAPEPYPIDVGIPQAIAVRSIQEADLTRPVPIYEGSYSVLANDTLRGIARNVMMTESKGRSNYYALNLTLQKQRSGDFYSFRFMYTLSYLENNTEDINFRAMDSNDFDAEWGPSINDRRHLINGIISFYPLNNLSITLAALIQSGQPINRIPDATIFGTTDLNGDGRSFGDAYVGNSDRQPGESRNNDRLPWSETFDLSIFYSVPLFENQVEVGAQVFNLFNTENLSGYSNNATQSNQIQVGPPANGIVRRNAAPPRQFQFSLRYLF